MFGGTWAVPLSCSQICDEEASQTHSGMRFLVEIFSGKTLQVCMCCSPLSREGEGQ